MVILNLSIIIGYIVLFNPFIQKYLQYLNEIKLGITVNRRSKLETWCI